MAVSPYEVARQLYASNMSVAELNAREAENRLLDEYAAAKRDYQTEHHHYTSRGRISPAATACAAPTPFCESSGLYTVGNILEYTEASEEVSRPNASAPPVTATAEGPVGGPLITGPTRSMVSHAWRTREREALRDSAVSFPAFSRYTVSSDLLLRGAVADVQASYALSSIAEVRRLMENAQRDVIERAMFPCLRQKPMLIEPSRELALKDALPLWQRVHMLRQETESEEEITYRNLQLGYEVQRDLLLRGILTLNPENKLLMAGPMSPAPSMYSDAIQFAFRAEKLAFETAEEGERMDIIDEAWVTKTNVLVAFFATAPVITAGE